MDHLTTIFAILSFLIAITSLISNVLLKKRLRAILNSSGESVEELLNSALGGVASIEKKQDEANLKISKIESKLAKSKRHVGIVRFDAFNDNAGLLSFAIAIFDDSGDGIIISSIHSRQGSHTYAKSLVGGNSEVKLTAEEIRAIDQAVDIAPRSVIK